MKNVEMSGSNKNMAVIHCKSSVTVADFTFLAQVKNGPRVTITIIFAKKPTMKSTMYKKVTTMQELSQAFKKYWCSNISRLLLVSKRKLHSKFQV